MGLLDDVMSQFGAASGRPIEPGHHGLARELLAMLAPTGMSGGLANLVNICHKRGLGEVVNSWISTGENLPITAEQARIILGSSEIQGLAARAGIDPQAATAAIAEILPRLVDKATPDGRIPATGELLRTISGAFRKS
ncbi:MAG TPA: YidB family protein [Thermoanaerobaculia bacterium]|nr:YidB family protein [Thermoanaerobaculia bacterium]